MTVDNDLGEAGRTGLRARKKLATREALSRAALRLALERGLENVRVDEIAAAAGVSPRTFNNYFSSREEAICFLGVQRAQRIGRALRARPADEPLDEAIGNAMAQEYAGHAEPDKVAMRMLVSEPGLRGEFLKGIVSLEEPLAEAIAARTGTDAERDLFPRVLAAAVSSAARTATGHYLRTDTTAPFATVVREAISVIAPAARAYGGGRE
ncbi:TetR/AcrR family transcriptional regulator [Actinomadura sp. HBU206391]|uniref:TetR/AcrR family transcriptional regulator n=1 Tax=Actinomadura sp. HBU206391 TaxID=2731692 RepID=UPI00164F4512|nr:TetR/AcrR family transcriptional regulator [Actinomadura sp. HBU206391]MBC6461754.1 TetR family transcriptional regulator [Actinomadura sp. HBU206391]